MVGLLALACLTTTAPAAGAVTRDGARAKALKATKAERSRPGTILFRLSTSLRPGTAIREAGRRPPPSGSSTRTMRSVLTVRGERAYFFYLDRGAYQRYEHPGRVVLVGARSGRVIRSRTLRFAPVIKGRLPIFLRSREAYNLPAYRVSTRPYAVAGATRARAAAAGLGAFGGEPSAGLRSAASEALVVARLAAERSCTIVIGGRSLSPGSIGSPSGTPVAPLLAYTPARGRSLSSFIATQAVARRGCRDIAIAVTGDGYRSLSPPTVRTSLSTSGSRMREHHLALASLRSAIASNPSVTFKLMIDGPGSGAFIEALRSLSNVLVIATSSTARQTAFRYLPEKEIAGNLRRNPLRMRSDSSFFTTLLFGGAAFSASDAEVVHAAAEVAAGRAPSFLAYMIARAFQLSRPFDFTADLGATQRLYTTFAVTPPGPLNRAPVADAQSVTTAEDTAKPIVLRRVRSRRRRADVRGRHPRARDAGRHGAQPDVHARRQLQRSRLLHVLGLRRDPHLRDGNGVDHRVIGRRSARDDGVGHAPLHGERPAGGYRARAHGDRRRLDEPDGRHRPDHGQSRRCGRPPRAPRAARDHGSLQRAERHADAVGSATVASYQAALRAVTYANSSENPGNAPRTVTFRSRDASGFGPSATRTITITPVNDDAVASDDARTVGEDSGATDFDVLTNDVDVDGDAIDIIAVGPAANGTTSVVNGAPDKVRYTPDADYCNDPGAAPTDDFSYTVNGGDTATVAVTVTCVDDPPVASDDARTVGEDSGATDFDVLTNDTDVEGDAIDIIAVGPAANGTTSVVNGAPDKVRYTPDADYCNDPGAAPTDDFSYTVNGNDTATVAVTVTCVDDLPVANDDARTVGEDSGATDFDVLSNDVDVDGDAIDIIAVGPAANGTTSVVNGAPDRVRYTPDADYCNDPGAAPTDDFTYTVNGNDTAMVAVTVTCVDDPPVANDDARTVGEDSGATDFDVLTNDTDVEGDAIDIIAVGPAANGTTSVVNGAPDKVRYTPDADYCNDPGAAPTDDFTYTVNGNDTATVAVTVTCVDDPPVANDDARTVGEDSGATDFDVLSNDVDVDGDAIDIIAVGPAANGTTSVVNGAPDKVRYTPDADYCNDPGAAPTDDFSYTVNGNDTATVAVTVTCVDDPPVANDDARTVGEDSGATDFDVLSNDVDVDGDAIDIIAVGPAANGTTSVVNGAPDKVRYTPDADYCNDPGAAPTDDFTYTVNGNDTATVAVTVTCVDDPPVANDDARTVGEDSGATDFDVLSNDTDVEGDAIDIIAVGPAANGTTSVVNGAPDKVRYTPDADYCNDPGAAPTDDFTYTVNGNDTATVAVTVTCVNDAPALDLDGGSAGTGSSATFTETNPHSGTGVLVVAASATLTDIDDDDMASATVRLTARPDGDAFESLSAAAGATGIGVAYTSATGTLALTGVASKASYLQVLKTVRYDNTKNPPDPASRSIEFTVNDGPLDSNTATATVAVVPLNTPPALDLDSANLASDDALAFFNEGAAAAVLAPNAQVTDADAGDDIESATITLTNRPNGGAESLAVTIPGASPISIAGGAYNPGTGVLALTGTATPAQYEAVLQTARYDNTSDAPDTAPRLVTFKVSDGQADSPTRTATVTVTATNDPPVNSVPGAQSTDEDTSKTLSTANANAVSVSDPDAGSSPLKVTLSVDNGTLTLAGTAGLSFSTGDGTADASMTFTGTQSAINAALGSGLTYAPPANFNGTATLTVLTEDQGASPSGNLTDTDTVTFNVAAVNDPPVNTVPGAQSVDEDTDLVLSGADAISVADVDAGSDDVQVVLSATDGTVTLSGTAGLTVAGDGTASVTATGSLTNLNAALAGLKYRGSPDFNGAATLSIDTSDLAHNPAPAQTDTDDVAITVNPVNDAPVADDDPFGDALGNTRFVVGTTSTGPRLTVAGDVLDGDTDVDTPAASLTAGPASITSTQCTGTCAGNVTMEADGEFTYDPKPGFTGTDTFTYTVSDNDAAAPANQTDTATVTITVVGPLVWYVEGDAGPAGDGRSHSPSKTLSALSTGGGLDGLDGSGDIIFVHDAASSYAGGLALEPNQQVLGEPHSLDVDPAGATPLQNDIVPAGGANPVILSGLVLSTNNTIQGINLGNVAGAALSGTAVGTAVMNTATPGQIDNQAGQAVQISGGSLNMAFSSVSSTGAGANAIALNSVSGTFTANGGTLADATGADVSLTGGSSNFTYGGTISDDVGQLVAISGETAGTKDFNGNITDLGDGDGGGISLTSNTGATIRFDGGLTLATAGNPAFSATGGGTLAVTDPAGAVTNLLATSTATALNVANTTISADDLTFQRISSNGAPSGIVLNNTGAAGGLAVTGDGSANSGGTIQSSSGPGISLTNVLGGVDLTRTNVTGGSDDGIRGTTVAGFTLADGQVTGNGNAGGEHGLDFAGLTGTSTLTDSNVSSNADSNVVVSNASGTLNLNVNRGTYSGAAGGQGDGIFVESTGTGSQNLNVQGPITFSNNVGDHIQHSGAPTSTADSDVTVNNATLSSPAGGGTVLGGGITVVEGGPTTGAGSNTDVTITNNNIQNSVIGAIAVGTTGSLASQQIANVDATITGNTIGATGAAGSGSVQGNGIFVDSNGNSNVRALIEANTIRQWTNRSGIALDVVDGDAQMAATIKNNTLTEPNSAFAGTTTRGMTLQLGTAQVGDSVDVCLDIGDSAIPLKNQVFGTGEGAQPDVRYLHEGPASAVELVGYAGPANPVIADIAGWFAPRNDIGGTPTVTGAATAAGASTTGAVSCPLPAP